MSNQPAVVLMFPVQPHVYKFLQHKCGEKLSVKKQDLYGSIVLDILSKRGKVELSNTASLTYPVEICLHYIPHHGIFIDSRVIRKFNLRLDKMFREEMRTYVSVSHANNAISKREALRQFLKAYSIEEDDIKMETLLKDLGRNID